MTVQAMASWPAARRRGGRAPERPAVEAIEVEFSGPAGAPPPAPPQPESGDALEAAVALAIAQVETLLLPSSMLGAGFELLRLEVKGGRQTMNFLLYNAFPENALTERGQEIAGFGAKDAEFAGGWLAAANEEVSKVDLEGVTFAGSGAVVDDLKDVSLLDYTLPQEQLLEQLGVELHGILGQPFFEKYDMDLDRYANRATFFSPGQASSQGFYSTVKHLPGIALPSGAIGLVVKGKAKPTDDELEGKDVSFIGLVDTGAAHTVLNWEAAKLLGYSGPSDPELTQATKVLGASDQGTADEMPVVQARLSLSSVPEGVKPMMSSVSKEQWESTGGDGWYFDKLDGGSQSVEMGAVNVAIGNVLGLSILQDSKIGAFTGAAAIIGQDLLFQAQRVILDSSNHQLWLEPGDIRDSPEM